jgi:nucleoside diphosphate kinase
MERSMYLIKPEGLRYREQIRHMITSTGLFIEHHFVAVLPRRIVEALYPDLAEAQNRLWGATLLQLLDRPCEIGLVSGQDAIAKLFGVAGTDFRPPLCKPNTIRYRFGNHTPIETGEGEYWYNAIHRSRSEVEVARDLQIIASLLNP